MSNDHKIDFLPLNTPTGKFLTELEQYRLIKTDIIRNTGYPYQINEISVRLKSKSDDQTIYIEGFISNKPKSGEGSAFLSLMTDLADKYDVILSLKACPYITPATKPYGRFGLKDIGFDAMLRKPIK
jgi:SOS-response transcriptional repressor LexA